MKGTKATMTIAQKKLDYALTMKKRPAERTASKKEKASKKNPGAPKRPPSAFFVFMEDFRKSFKENFPDNKSVAVVTKAGGEKWKTMSETEKSTYMAMAAKRKAEYEKAKEEFNKNPLQNGQEASTSEKSSTEIHDDAEQEASS